MTLFYELMQVALGTRNVLSKSPSDKEWSSLYMRCREQAVTGIALDALDLLARQGQKPPTKLLYQWIGEAEQIKARNLLVNRRCIEVTQKLSEAGFLTCILKGQGNGRMYPHPLSRVPGDIDIWVVSHIDGTDFTDKKLRKKIDSFVNEKFPHVEGGRMHIDFPVFQDVPVEVHYMPRYMNAPRSNRRMQTFFRKKADEQLRNKVILEGAEGTCAVPTAEFNLVQQMSHLMSHAMGEGIGLRQFVDYYYVLRQMKIENGELETLLNDMGLLKFAQGVMWVERELLGLECRYLVVEPSEKIGRWLQKKIEEGGNFGHYNHVNLVRRGSLLGRFWGGAQQSLCSMRYFPKEATWKIIRKFGMA